MSLEILGRIVLFIKEIRSPETLGGQSGMNQRQVESQKKSDAANTWYRIDESHSIPGLNGVVPPQIVSSKKSVHSKSSEVLSG